jgi:hypothetical protein
LVDALHHLIEHADANQFEIGAAVTCLRQNFPDYDDYDPEEQLEWRAARFKSVGLTQNTIDAFNELIAGVARHAAMGRTHWVAAAPSAEGLNGRGGESKGWLPGVIGGSWPMRFTVNCYAGIVAECKQRHSTLSAWAHKHAISDMAQAKAAGDEAMCARGERLARELINAEWHVVEHLASLLRDRRVLRYKDMWPVLSTVRWRLSVDEWLVCKD